MKHVSSDLPILIVDDSATALQVMSSILADFGFNNISKAGSGAEAWGKINSQGDFALVLSDWNMPDMTGIELLSKVRSDDRFTDVPFVLVTTNSDKEYVVQASGKGVNGFIVKPYTSALLEEKLTELFKQEERSDE